jgi:hypothetical protein
MSESTRARVAAACFVVGCLLVFLVDETITRAIGVPLIFVGICLGVIAIASPEFLSGDRDAGAED